MAKKASRTWSRSGTAEKPATPRKGIDAPPVRVRMYRQGLGDCFLLTFGAGAAARHMLIDCGTLGTSTNPKNTLESVVADIEDVTKGELAVLVATHEHKDHLSGFNSEADWFGRSRIGRVWLAWTEDPKDKLAQQMAEDRRDVAVALAAVVQAAAAGASAAARSSSADSRTQEAAAAARDLLDFAGLDAAGLDTTGVGFAETIDRAMRFVRDGLQVRPTYLRPGGRPIEVDDIPGFRFYVLGPPRDLDVLAEMGEHGSSHLYGLRAAAMGHAAAAAGALMSSGEVDACELEMPFDLMARAPMSGAVWAESSTYFDPQHAWRRVDQDWLHTAAEVALQLDDRTNNTSLALAIERIADGRVLLFPGDAQLGPWRSWQNLSWEVTDHQGEPEQVRMSDLLSRTVFYKASHHASHNGTPKPEGLEQMSRETELVAFIPVDRRVALGRHPKGSWKMPARPLYRRLLERCQGRVVRSDVGWARDAADLRTSDERNVEAEFFRLASEAEWNKWIKRQEQAEKSGLVRVEKMFVDYVLD